MDVSAVIGANFGDEGKGVITDALACRRPDAVVVMTNGGAQRGHTVVHAPTGKKHMFHHFGSGTFRGCATYFPETFILNPMQFVKEYMELTERFGVGNIFSVRHRKCLFSTPFDMILNQDIENWRKSQGKGYGTCGMGIWETQVRFYESLYNPFSSLDLFNIAPHEEKLSFLKDVRDKHCPARYRGITGKDWAPEDWVLSDGLIEHYINDVAFMCSVCPVEGDKGYSFLAKQENLIFENGQGLLLDDEYDGCDTIYATPSRTGMRFVGKILKALQIDFGAVTRRLDAYYVSRPYATIHGPAQTRKVERSFGSFHEDPSESNKENEFQGKFFEGALNQKIQAETIKQDMKNYLRPIRANMKTATLAYTHLDQSSPQLMLFPDVAECGTAEGGKEVKGLKW